MDGNWHQYNQYGRVPPTLPNPVIGYPGVHPSPPVYGIPPVYGQPLGMPPHDAIVPSFGGTYSGSGSLYAPRPTRYPNDPLSISDRLPVPGPGYSSQYSALPLYEMMTPPTSGSTLSQDPFSLCHGLLNKPNAYAPGHGLPSKLDPYSSAHGLSSNPHPYSQSHGLSSKFDAYAHGHGSSNKTDLYAPGHGLPSKPDLYTPGYGILSKTNTVIEPTLDASAPSLESSHTYQSSVVKPGVPPIETLRRSNVKKVQTLPSVNKLLNLNISGVEKSADTKSLYPDGHSSGGDSGGNYLSEFKTSPKNRKKQNVKNSLTELLTDTTGGGTSSLQPISETSTELSKKMYEDIIKAKQQSNVYSGVELSKEFPDTITPQNNQHPPQQISNHSHGQQQLSTYSDHKILGNGGQPEPTAVVMSNDGAPQSDYLHFDSNFGSAMKGKAVHDPQYQLGHVLYNQVVDPYRGNLLNLQPYDMAPQQQLERKQPIQAPADSTTKPKKRRRKKDKVTDTLAGMKTNMNIPIYDHMPQNQMPSNNMLSGNMGGMGTLPNNMLMKQFDQQTGAVYDQSQIPPYQIQKQTDSFQNVGPTAEQPGENDTLNYPSHQQSEMSGNYSSDIFRSTMSQSTEPFDAMSQLTATAEQLSVVSQEQTPQQGIQQLYDSLHPQQATDKHPPIESYDSHNLPSDFNNSSQHRNNVQQGSTLFDAMPGKQPSGTNMKSPQHVSSTEQSPQQSGVPPSPLQAYGNAVPPSPQQSYASTVAQSPQQYMGSHVTSSPQQSMGSNMAHSPQQSLIGSTQSPQQLNANMTQSPQQPMGTIMAQSPQQLYGLNVTQSPQQQINTTMIQSPQQPIASSIPSNHQHPNGSSMTPNQQMLGCNMSQSQQQKLPIQQDSFGSQALLNSQQALSSNFPYQNEDENFMQSPQHMVVPIVPPGPQEVFSSGIASSPQQSFGSPPLHNQQHSYYSDVPEHGGVLPSVQHTFGSHQNITHTVSSKISPGVCGVNATPPKKKRAYVRKKKPPVLPANETMMQPKVKQNPLNSQIGTSMPMLSPPIIPSKENVITSNPDPDLNQLTFADEPHGKSEIVESSKACEPSKFEPLKPIDGMSMLSPPILSPGENVVMKDQSPNQMMFDGEPQSKSDIVEAFEACEPSRIEPLKSIDGMSMLSPPILSPRENVVMKDQSPNQMMFDGEQQSKSDIVEACEPSRIEPSKSIDGMSMLSPPILSPRENVVMKDQSPNQMMFDGEQQSKSDIVESFEACEPSRIEPLKSIDGMSIRQTSPPILSPRVNEVTKDQRSNQMMFDGEQQSKREIVESFEACEPSRIEPLKSIDGMSMLSPPILSPRENVIMKDQSPNQMMFDDEQQSKNGIVKSSKTFEPSNNANIKLDVDPAAVVSGPVLTKAQRKSFEKTRKTDVPVLKAIRDVNEEKVSSFYSSFKNLLQKKPDASSSTSPSDIQSLNMPPADVRKGKSSGNTSICKADNFPHMIENWKGNSGFEHLVTSLGRTKKQPHITTEQNEHRTPKGKPTNLETTVPLSNSSTLSFVPDRAVKTSPPKMIKAVQKSPVIKSVRQPKPVHQGAKTKDQLSMKIQQLKAKKRAHDMALKLQREQQQKDSKKIDELLENTDAEIKQTAAKIVSHLIGKKIPEDKDVDVPSVAFLGQKLTTQPKIGRPVLDLTEYKTTPVKAHEDIPTLVEINKLSEQKEVEALFKELPTIALINQCHAHHKRNQLSERVIKSNKPIKEKIVMSTIKSVVIDDVKISNNIIPKQQRPPLLGHKKEKKKRKKSKHHNSEWMGDVYGLQGEKLIEVAGGLPKEEIPTRQTGTRRAKEVVEEKRHKTAEKKVRKRCRQFYSEVAWDSSSDDQEYFFISTESESSSEDEDPAWMPQQGQPNTMKVLAGVTEEETGPDGKLKRRRKSSTSGTTPVGKKRGVLMAHKVRTGNNSSKVVGTVTQSVHTPPSTPIWPIDTFVVNKAEFTAVEQQETEMFTIWRVDSDSSMQKYEPTRLDGELKHRAEPTYSRYTAITKRLFRVIRVGEVEAVKGIDVVKILDSDLPSSYLMATNSTDTAIVLSDNDEELSSVQVTHIKTEPMDSPMSTPSDDRKPTPSTLENPGPVHSPALAASVPSTSPEPSVPSISPAPSDSVKSSPYTSTTSGGATYRFISGITSSMNVYVQILVSHVLQPGILSAIMDSKDEYYSVPLGQVDALIKDYLNQLQPLVSKWKEEFLKCIEKSSNLSVLTSDKRGIKVCSCCASCLDKNNTDFYKMLRLSGNVYHYSNLEVSVCEDTLMNEEWVVCGESNLLVETYHKLYHFKYHLANQCENKISKLKQSNTTIDTRGLLDQCLHDKEWILSIQAGLDDLCSDAKMLLSMAQILND